MSFDIDVLLIEDDPRCAMAICEILGFAGYDRVEVAGTAEAAELRVQVRPPDLILADLGLPDRDGAELIHSLRASNYDQPVLVLTVATNDQAVLGALRAGADGYLFKEDIDVRLVAALGDLLRGGAPLSPGAARIVLNELGFACRTLKIPNMTHRESEVLEWLALGSGYANIAKALGIGLNTVRTHIRSMYEKLGVENRAEAVNLAWNLGLLRHAIPKAGPGRDGTLMDDDGEESKIADSWKEAHT